MTAEKPTFEEQVIFAAKLLKLPEDLPANRRHSRLVESSRPETLARMRKLHQPRYTGHRVLRYDTPRI